MRTLLTLSLVGLCMLGSSLSARAEDEKAAGAEISLADGKLTLTAPADWKKQEPSVRIIEYEFSIPAAEGDENDGRLTIMGAGGSVEANIDRWIGQFSQPDNKSTKDRTKQEKITVDGQTVHLVDISGTYKDQRGPFAPATIYKDYRMLAAIIATDKSGQYFVKFTGPAKTVAANEKAFRELIESLEVK